MCVHTRICIYNIQSYTCVKLITFYENYTYPKFFKIIFNILLILVVLSLKKVIKYNPSKGDFIMTFKIGEGATVYWQNKCQKPLFRRY